MDYQNIIETVTNVFTGTDQRNWQLVKETFADKVLLDYSSMSNQPANTLSPDDIVNAWKGLMPGFQHTHHQLGNFNVKQQDDEAHVFCYGTATHYLPNNSGNNLWTVVGTYDFDLKKVSGQWKVHHMVFHFKYQDGNSELLALAIEKAKVNIK